MANQAKDQSANMPLFVVRLVDGFLVFLSAYACYEVCAGAGFLGFPIFRSSTAPVGLLLVMFVVYLLIGTGTALFFVLSFLPNVKHRALAVAAASIVTSVGLFGFVLYVIATLIYVAVAGPRLTSPVVELNLKRPTEPSILPGSPPSTPNSIKQVFPSSQSLAPDDVSVTNAAMPKQ